MNMSQEGDKDKRVDRGYKRKRFVDPCLVMLHSFFVTCKLKRLILLTDRAYTILKKEEKLNYNKIEKWIKFGKKNIRF